MDGLEELCEVIERNRQVAEDDARLAPEVSEAAGEAGLWLLGAPRDLGGHELSLPALAGVLATLGRTDPTVAWHAMNSLGIGTAAAALGTQEARRVLDGGVRPFGYSGIATQARARTEGDGYRLEGSWPFLTGAADAVWALVSAVVDDESAPDGPPRPRRFVVRLDGLDVGDNWVASSALRGTGSHAVSTPAGGVLVPPGYSLSMTPTLRLDRPLYRVPVGVVFVGSAPSVVLGTLRRALDATIELAREKRSRLDGHAHGDEVRVQQAIVDTDAEHRCLTAGYLEVLEEIWVEAEAGEPLPDELRARFWSTLFLTVDRSRELVSRLFSVATSAAYATRNPVERALRDIHAMSAALESFQALRWASARVMLGHEARHPMF